MVRVIILILYFGILNVCIVFLKRLFAEATGLPFGGTGFGVA